MEKTTEKTQSSIENKPPFEETRRSVVIPYVNRFLTIIDDVILIWVALGIIGVAALLMLEAVTDFVYYNEHSFSLNPFIFIGVIASIRGLLLTQMKVGMGEAQWDSGLLQLAAHAVIVLILVASLYVYSRVRSKDI